MPCPACQKVFQIPESGIDSLPRNEFLEKLLQIEMITKKASADILCDVCGDDDDDAEPRGKAVTYCVECHDNLCDGCSKAHRKVKLSRSHTQIKFGDPGKQAEEQLLHNAAPATCDKHQNQTLDVFCRDCKVAICVICYIGVHKQHDCADIKEVIEGFRQQMHSDIDSLKLGMATLSDMSSSLEKQKSDLIKQVAETEDEIIKKADWLKELIETHKQKLIYELGTKKRKAVKHLENQDDDVTRRRSCMERVKAYTEEVTKKGTAGDIARDSSMLHERSEELTMLESVKEARRNIGGLAMKFTESSLLSGETVNAVGEINFTGDSVKNCTVS